MGFDEGKTNLLVFGEEEIPFGREQTTRKSCNYLVIFHFTIFSIIRYQRFTSSYLLGAANCALDLFESWFDPKTD